MTKTSEPYADLITGDKHYACCGAAVKWEHSPNCPSRQPSRMAL